MAFSFPIIKNGNDICGSCVFFKRKEKKHFFLTTLHQIGAEKAVFGLMLPPTSGNVKAWQPYPTTNIPYMRGEIIKCDPYLDLAVFACDLDISPLPESINFEDKSSNYQIGKKVAVIGYPFSVIGSFVLTCDQSSISALLVRTIIPSVQFPELALSHLSHPGSSGSAVVDSETGRLLGILRGAIAPPVSMMMGNLPVGSDSNISVATASLSITPFIKDI